MSIVTYYDCKIDAKYKVGSGNDLDDFLSLLKNYDEFPENDFLITFDSDYFYYPSAVAQLRYEMVYKMHNIEVKSLDGRNVSRYSYIRGSLSYKETIALKRNGEVEKKIINFMWDDGKLMKAEAE